jgi:hypothetical protein
MNAHTQAYFWWLMLHTPDCVTVRPDVDVRAWREVVDAVLCSKQLQTTLSQVSKVRYTVGK